MANTLREVPRVKVISRHRDDCKRKDKGSNYLRCDCPKTLYWSEGGGKPCYESASTNDYQVAERRARDKEAAFAAIAAGQAPEPERTGKAVEEAVNIVRQPHRSHGAVEQHRLQCDALVGCGRSAVFDGPTGAALHLCEIHAVFRRCDHL